MHMKTAVVAVLVAAFSLPVFAQNQHCQPVSNHERAVEAENPFASSDQARLIAALNEATIDPIEAIRQQVLSDRRQANAQLQAVLAIAEAKEREQAKLVVIESKSARVHSHGREYWVAIGLVSNGEMQAQVAIATCNGHGYDLHQVNNIHDTPHAVQRQVRHLNHQLISTFPNHSPELAATSWRVRNAVTQQRGETNEQFAALVEVMSDQQTVQTSSNEIN
ncbi:MAG: hypothetical protein AAGB26_02920 [Planctomycetota bacterium]